MISRHTDEQAGCRQGVTHISQVVRQCMISSLSLFELTQHHPVYFKVLLFLLILYPCHMKGDCKAFQTHERDFGWALYKMLYVWWWRRVWKELFWHHKEWLRWNHGCWTPSGYVRREIYEVRLHWALWTDIYCRYSCIDCSCKHRYKWRQTLKQLNTSIMIL